MKAAVVESFNKPPQWRDAPEPQLQADEVLVRMKAVALTQLVKAQAAGKHYSSGKLPFIPGVDGVGVLANGQRVLVAFPRGAGTFAERVAVPTANVVPLPDELDDISAAAIANPGMSSWASLTERAHLQRGETVLINGANGASGRLAIRIARHLGAGRIVVTARDAACWPELRSLGADAFVQLHADRDGLIKVFRTQIGQGIHIVLDYLWGLPADAFLAACMSHGSADAAPRIRFVNIGSVAGASVALNAGVLRSSGLEMMGSGLGSVSHVSLIDAMAQVMRIAVAERLSIDVLARDMCEVSEAWQETTRSRIVFQIS